VPGNHTVIQNY